MKIRFIATTYTSEQDRYGNCFHYARITSTLTGKYLWVRNVGGDNNARILVQHALNPEHLEHSACYEVHIMLPKRKWQACEPVNSYYESEVTPALILNLEAQ